MGWNPLGRPRRVVITIGLVAGLLTPVGGHELRAAPVTVFGDWLEYETQLPGLWATNLTVPTAGREYETVGYFDDRDHVVATTGNRFTVIDLESFGVRHEEQVTGSIVALDISDDDTVMVVGTDAQQLIWYSTDDWAVIAQQAVPAGITLDRLEVAPGSVERVVVAGTGGVAVVDAAAVVVPRFDTLAGSPFQPLGVLWGADSSSLLALSPGKMQRIAIGGGSPTLAAELTVPTPGGVTPWEPLYRIGGAVASGFGFSIDPAALTVTETWDPASQRYGREGSDTVVVRTGATIEVREPGQPPKLFAMPRPFATDATFMMPLLGAHVAYVGGDRLMRRADTEVLASPSGDFHGVTPARVFDTRTPLGQATATPLGAADTRTVHIAGRGGVPASGVDAVVINVTAIGATAPTYLSVSPTGAPLPDVSNINIDSSLTLPGAAVANLATVQLGDDGAIALFNSAGSVDVAIDVAGYYSDATGARGSRYVPLAAPLRVADTRRNLGSLGRRLGPDTTRQLDVNAALGGAAAVSSVVLHVTAIDPSALGYVTVSPSDVARPDVSNINVMATRTTPNLAIVRLPTNRVIDLYNLAGQVDIAVDLVGYYQDRSTGPVDQAGRFQPVTPKRLLDTRVSSPFPAPGAMPADSAVIFTSQNAGGATGQIVDSDIGWTKVVNVTAVSPTEPGFLSMAPATAGARWPGLPGTSTVNFGPGQVRPNLAYATAAPDWAVYHSNGLTQVLVDQFGTITPADPTTWVPVFVL